MMASILALLILCLGPVSSDELAPIDQHLSALVSELGHRKYRVRENAGKKLIEAGLSALPAVRKGTKSSNLEIANRCKRLLSAIPEADRLQKIDELLTPFVGPIPKGLPELERFLSITGNTREARELYAEMLREHHEILEAMEKKPHLVSKLMDAFCQNLCETALLKSKSIDENFDCHPFLFDHRSEVTLFLFVRGKQRAESFSLGPVNYRFPAADLMQKLLLDSESSSAFRKLFIEWYQNEQTTILLGQASNIVVKGEMRELLPLMLRRLADNDTDAASKSMLLEDIHRLGDHKLIGRIEHLITDKTVIMEHRWLRGARDSFKSELKLGDIALYICWHWAGQNQLDLGTAYQILSDEEKQRSDIWFNASFADETRRQAAHVNWKTLRTITAEEEKKPIKRR